MATQNPPGSSDPRDLIVNAGNLDVLVTSKEKLSQDDRLGVPRKTWHGMEVEFDQAQGQRSGEFDSAQTDRSERFDTFMDGSAYFGTGPNGEYQTYAAGITFTERNQVVYAAGEAWKPASETVLPYTTTGAGMPEDDAFVAVGDAVLRQELADPAQGAAKVARGVVAVDSIADLLALPAGQRREDLRYLVKGYHAGSDIGGGAFYWDASSTTAPNGRTVLGSGVGRFLGLARSSRYKTEEWGIDASGSTDAVVRLQACLDEMDRNGGGVLDFLPGVYLFESGAVHLPSNVTINGNGSAILISAASPTNENFLTATEKTKITISGFSVKAEQFVARIFQFIRCSDINLSYILNETDRTVGGEQSIIKNLARFRDVRGIDIRHIMSTYSVASLMRCRDVLVENIRCVQPEKITQECEVFDAPGIENAVFRNIYAEGLSDDALDLSALRNVLVENVIVKNCNSGITLKTESPGVTPWPYLNPNNVVIRNVHVEGWESTNGGIHINATAIAGNQWAGNVLIENCTIVDPTGSAPIGLRIAINSGNEDKTSLTIRNCAFGTDQNSAGDIQIRCYGQNITIEDCRFYGGMGGTHAIRHSSGRNLTISKCKFYAFNPGSNGALFLYTTEGTASGRDYHQNIKLMGCSFFDCVAPNGNTVRIGSSRAAGSYIAGNMFVAPADSSRASDLLLHNQDDWIVEGNTFSSAERAISQPGAGNGRRFGNINVKDRLRLNSTDYYPTWSTSISEPG